jgi:hypothetical protein
MHSPWSGIEHASRRRSGRGHGASGSGDAEPGACELAAEGGRGAGGSPDDPDEDDAVLH